MFWKQPDTRCITEPNIPGVTTRIFIFSSIEKGNNQASAFPCGRKWFSKGITA